MSNIDLLEARLGYRFRNAKYLTQALSHRSTGSPNNERLEYLGDSILGYVIAEALYHQFPDLSEGDLTKMRASLVRRNTLAKLARVLKFQDYLLMGSGELKSGGHNRTSILSDAFEATIGAMYLDGGMTVVKNFLGNIYKDLLENLDPTELKDSKTLLQETLQKREIPLPVYELIGQAGQDHNLTFTVSCKVPGTLTVGTALGASRKMAEQRAAALVLKVLNE